MASPPVLPSEIPLDVICCILDQCQEDTPILKDCALVSHSWLPIAQSHLFSRIKITSKWGRDLPSFRSLIRQSPSLRLYVRTLSLHHDVTVTEVWGVVDCLPNLRSLELLSLAVKPEPFGSLTSPSLPQPTSVASVSNLDTLHFWFCQTPGPSCSWERIFDIVNKFDSITTLRLLGLWEPLPTHYVPQVRSGTSSLRPSITQKTIVKNLRYTSGEHNLNWSLVKLLLERTMVEQLQFMVIGQGLCRVEEATQALINNATELSCLLIQLFRGGMNDRTNKTPLYSLRSLRSLNSITFMLPNNPRGHIISIATSHIVKTLSSLHSPLSEFRLEICMPPCNAPTIVRSMDWSQLGTALERFGQLRSVEVIHIDKMKSPPPGSAVLEQDLAKTIREGLGTLAHRCAVQVRREFSARWQWNHV